MNFQIQTPTFFDERRFSYFIWSKIFCTLIKHRTFNIFVVGIDRDLHSWLLILSSCPELLSSLVGFNSRSGGGGALRPRSFWSGCVWCPVIMIKTYLEPKYVFFRYPFSKAGIRFQTWLLKSMLVFKPDFKNPYLRKLIWTSDRND